MTCSRCGQESPADARFCVGCGSPLRAGAEPPELQPSEPHGEGLAPRDVGALVGAAFTLYRENFASLVTIALPPQVTLYLSAVSSSAVSWALLAISLIGYLLAYAAIVFAAAQRLVEPAIDLGLCLSRTRERAKPLIGANLILAVGLTASALLAFLIVGVPLFVFILVRWFFLAPAIMIEGRDAMGALRRSSTLVEGSWWRVFGIGLVFVLVTMGLVVLASLPGGVIGAVNSNAGTLVSVAINALVFPIAPVGATLVYLDLRLRKEGYTLGDLSLEIRPRDP